MIISKFEYGTTFNNVASVLEMKAHMQEGKLARVQRSHSQIFFGINMDAKVIGREDVYKHAALNRLV